MINIDDHRLRGICPETNEMLLTPLEKYAAWSVITKEQNVLRMGKYFYIGMNAPSSIPKEWWQVDCHLLGFLTERKCRLLRQEHKDFIEHFILGERYKEYRRFLQKSEEPTKG
jgi:hypothetical protein